MWTFALEVYLLIGVILAVASTLDPKILKEQFKQQTQGLPMYYKVLLAIVAPAAFILLYPWVIASVIRDKNRG